MTTLKRTALATAVAMTAALSLMAASPNAAPRDTGPTAPTPTRFTLKRIPVSAVHHAWQPPRIRNKNGSSLNWSGYAVLPLTQSPLVNSSKNSKQSHGKKPTSSSSPTFSGVSGTWVVPAVKASTSTNTYSSTWVGLDGYSDSTVEQIGTEQDWSSGSPVYYAWFEMYPKSAYLILNFPVKPGDVIEASVVYTSKGSFTLTITNDSETTQNKKPVTFSITERLQSAQRLSAEWIVEAPWSGGVLPLADFGTITFSNCQATMNGHTGPIDDSSWQNDPITMETSSVSIEAEPSALSSSGDGFSVQWHSE